MKTSVYTKRFRNSVQCCPRAFYDEKEQFSDSDTNGVELDPIRTNIAKLIPDKCERLARNPPTPNETITVFDSNFLMIFHQSLQTRCRMNYFHILTFAILALIMQQTDELFGLVNIHFKKWLFNTNGY